jgi:large conductance mechanosensitive channel
MPVMAPSREFLVALSPKRGMSPELYFLAPVPTKSVFLTKMSVISGSLLPTNLNLAKLLSKITKLSTNMKGFVEFVRTQGVVGLAVGIILGGSVKNLVTSLVSDIINPIMGLFLGSAGSLKEAYLSIGPVKLMWGNFVNSVIDFAIIAAVVYFGVTALKLDKIDKKKE